MKEIIVETNMRVPPILAAALWKLAEDYAAKFDEPFEASLQLVWTAVLQRGLKAVQEELDR